MLVIHPDECIDCALCEPECPVDAIFSEDEIPEDQLNFLELNTELAEIWPNIVEMKPAPADAEEWNNKPTRTLKHSTLADHRSGVNWVTVAAQFKV